MERIRIMVVDDHPAFRDGLAKLLSETGSVEVIATASDGAEAVALAASHQPDVILMDLKMPGMNGIEATRLITEDAPRTARVVVLTMMEDNDSVFAAVRAGAAGYILKGTEVDRIVDAISFVADGGSILGPGLALRAKTFLQPAEEQPAPAPAAAASPTRKAAFPYLTERELELLDLVAAGHDNIEIARILTISEKTVRNHVSNILGKVQLANRYKLIVGARDAGFGSGH
ncbi:response regulator [Nocardioides sp. GCM10028917]|uniref:response regulator n=1 Tax=Nocardioides sp. GCM10028917 TaxID=3273408 RepID=UPI0036067A28